MSLEEETTISVRLSNKDVTFTNTLWPRDLMNTLDTMREEDVFCDVNLEVPVLSKDGKTTKRILPAHACVLAAASDLFKSILDKEIKRRHIVMKDFEEDALLSCLWYIYGQEIKVEFDRVEHLKKAAETLMLTSLSTQCQVALDTLEQKPALKKKLKSQSKNKKTKEKIVSGDNEDDASECGKTNIVLKEEKKEESIINLPVDDDDNGDGTHTFDDETKASDDGTKASDDETKVCDDETKASVDETKAPVKNESSQNPSTKDNAEDALLVEIITIQPVSYPSNTTETVEENMDVDHSVYKPESDEEGSSDSEHSNNESRVRKPSGKRKMTTRASVGTFRCDHCSLFFSTKSNLTAHQKRLAEDPHWIPIKGGSKPRRTAEQKRQTRNNLNAKSELKQYTCKECDEKFQGFKRLFRHRRVAHEKLFVCQHCSKACVADRELKAHEASCKSKFTPEERAEQLALRRQKRKETQEKRKREATAVKMDPDGKPLDPQPDEVKKEGDSTSKVKTFLCDHCAVVFRTKGAFLKHQQKVAENPDYIQGKKPKQSYAEFRRKHNVLRQKYEQRDYECKECGQVFFGIRNLYKHRNKIHKKNNMCPYCNKVFEYPALLKIHVKRHTNEKDFMCTQCDYRAVTMHEIRFHEQREHLNLQFHCRHCSAVFRTQTALGSHEALHKKKPLKCEHCDYVTVVPGTLRMHVLNKHFPDKREPCICEICERAFTQRGHLNRHMKTTHGVQLPALIPSRRVAVLEEFSQDRIIYATDQSHNVEAHDEGGGGEIYGIQYQTANNESMQLEQSLESNNIIIQEAHSATENLIIQEVDELEGVVYYYTEDVEEKDVEEEEETEEAHLAEAHLEETN